MNSNPVTAAAQGSETTSRLVLMASALLFGVLCVLELLVVRPEGNFNASYYEELADAFQAGQSYLLRPPPPGLLALPDPWDPVANETYRDRPERPGERYEGVHDLTLYGGRFYLEWGPFPALVLIPLRWLAGGDLPMGRLVPMVENLAGLTFAEAAWRLTKAAGAPPSRFLRFVTAPLFLLCPVWANLLRRIAVYETAVFFSQLCVSLALLATIVAFEREAGRAGRGVGWLALGSVLLGCAINCRPDLIPLGLIIPVILGLWWRATPAPRNWRRMIAPAFSLGTPALLLLICVFAYNILRFGDILEVGQNWQLWGGDESAWMRKLNFTDPARFLPNVWYFFFAPLAVSERCPLLFQPSLISPLSLVGPAWAARYGVYIAPTSGLFVIMPLTILVMGAPLLFVKGFRVGQRGQAIVPVILLAGFLAGILPFLAPVQLRYGAEWCMWWPVAATVIASLLRRSLRSHGMRMRAILFDAALALSSIWSVWVGISFLVG